MARLKKQYSNGTSRGGGYTARASAVKRYDRTTQAHPEAAKREAQLATDKKNFDRYLPGRVMHR